MPMCLKFVLCRPFPGWKSATYQSTDLRPRRSWRVEHYGNDGGVVGPEVVSVPTGDGAVHETLRRIDPLSLSSRIEHVLLVGFFRVTHNTHGLKIELLTFLFSTEGVSLPYGTRWGGHLLREV